MDFIRGYDKWLTTPPADGPEGCEYCGELPEQDSLGDYYCANKFCPEKFQGTEQKMAEALVDALEEIRTLKAKLERSRREVASLVEQYSNSGLE